MVGVTDLVLSVVGTEGEPNLAWAEFAGRGRYRQRCHLPQTSRRMTGLAIIIVVFSSFCSPECSFACMGFNVIA